MIYDRYMLLTNFNKIKVEMYNNYYIKIKCLTKRFKFIFTPNWYYWYRYNEKIDTS